MTRLPRTVLSLAAIAMVVALAACGGDDEEEARPAEASTLTEPKTEDELAFCLGLMADPKLDDAGIVEQASDCTGISREELEGNIPLVACFSGVARSAANEQVEERVARCEQIFR